MRTSLFVLSLFAFVSTYSTGQGNTCATAYSFGTLPTPVGCGGPGGTGIGAQESHNGTNVGATAANPYTYILDCGSGTTDMASPALDVWYSFVATGTQLFVNLNSTIPQVNFGLYTGSCSQLQAFGCAIGDASGDITNLLFEPLTPGQTYFIQISGNNSTATGNWSLALNNNFDCNDCLQESVLTVSPLPFNGTYPPGTQVTFCYTITEYNQVSSNWLHGVQVAHSGWSGALTNPVSPGSCDGNGSWGYIASGTDIPAGFSAGFYYNSSLGCNACDATDPEDNYGDANAESCDLEFCWTLTTPTSCTPGVPIPLSVTINTSADGESGSWTSAACQDDVSTIFEAAVACCATPTMSMTQETCFGTANGSATATLSGGAGPFDYIWYNSSGTELQNVTNSASLSNTLSNISSGTYQVIVVDNNNCASSNTIVVTQGAGPSAVVPASLSICENGTIASTSFTSNPTGGTFTWTNNNTDIGLPASGSGQIGSFTALNTGSTSITATISVQATIAGCTGVPTTYTITVNPAPDVAISAVPDATICQGESVPLTGSYTPQPVASEQTFENTTYTAITNSNSAILTNVSTTSFGITPTDLIANQIVSACFTIRHEDYSEFTVLQLNVGGTIYTSVNPAPVGQIHEPSLTTLLTSIQGTPQPGGSPPPPPTTATFCIPEALLTIIENGSISSNTTWTIGITDATGGADNGGFLEWEVIIQDIPQLSYSWSPTGSVISGTTTGVTTGGPLNVTVQPTTNTTYTLSVTDENGCIGTNTISISVVAGPTATIDGSSSYCSSAAPNTGVSIPVTLTGTPNWTLTYDTDGNLATLADQVTVSGITSSPYNITNALAGTYQLVAVTDQGCSGGTVSGTFIVTATSPPSVNVLGDITVCPLDPINPDDFVSTPGGATFTWTNTNPSIGLAASGSGQIITYNAPSNNTGTPISGTITVTPSFGSCSGTPETFTVNISPSPQVNDPADVIVCPTGTIDPADFVSNPSGATFTWTNSNTNIGLAASGTGQITSYTAPTNGSGSQVSGDVTITPTLNGCIGTSQVFVISVDPTPIITLTPNSPAICNGTDGSILVSGTGSGTVNWSGPVTGSQSGAALNYTIPNLSAGSYDITYTNATTGCISAVTQTTLINPGAPIINNPGNSTVCNSYTLPAISGTNLTASVSYFTGSNGGGTPLSAGDPITTTQLIYIYDNNGSCSNEVSFTVNVDYTPTLTNPGPQVVCDSYTLPLITGTQLSGNQSYYSNSQALFGTSISGSITSSQTVWIYDADGACTDEESFVVTVNATPTFSLSSSSPTTCNGTNGTITITGLNPNTSYSVNYSDNGNPVSNTLNSDGSGVILITGQDAGTYNNFSVTLNGCSGTNPGILTLSNPNAPVIDDIADQTVCDSYVLPTITGSNLTSSASYWTAPLGTGSQLTAGNALTTTQTVYIYDANGLCTSEQSFTITIDYTPIINNPGPQLACDTYTLPVITGSALPGSQAYFDDSQLNGGTSISGNLSASQTVWVFAADGACSDEVSFTVTINYTPVLNNPGNQVVCDTYSLPVITGTNLSGNELYYDNSQANNGSDITGPITSDQTIWIFDFDGQCSDEESFTLTINQTPFIDDVPDQIVCDSYSLTPITGSNLSGSQSYYNNSQALGGTVLTGNILSSQTVWIYDAEGSCSDEESFNITVNNTPVVDDVPDVVVCDNFSLPTITGTSLSGTQAFYNDSQINGGTVISGSITSSQTIWIYDSEGSCSDEESFEITVNETPSLSDPGDQIACDTYTLPLVQGTNLTPNAAYYTNTPALGGTVLNGTINSSQTIWIFDADGLCADSTSFMVTINETPQLQINNPEPVCEPVTIDLTAPEITAGSSSATSLSYWTDAGATSSLSNPSAIAASGTYYISADNDGCSDIASVVATINPIPPAPLAGTNATYCSVWAIEPLNVSGSGGTFTWYDANGTVLGTGTTFTPENTIGTTTYSVTETLIGCEGPPSVVSITINLCEIYIPTAFTPTGNGVNDTWEIVDIDQVYPLNVVMIYSRWGNLLFKHDSSTDGPYDQHRWDGTYEGSAMPVGSYYFIIETGLENEEAITGTVSIIKK